MTTGAVYRTALDGRVLADSTPAASGLLAEFERPGTLEVMVPVPPGTVLNEVRVTDAAGRTLPLALPGGAARPAVIGWPRARRTIRMSAPAMANSFADDCSSPGT